MVGQTVNWDRPEPFTIQHSVADDEIDGLNHTNNVEYLRWLERAAWAHSASLGLDLDAYRRLDRAMVAHRHEIDYLAPSFAGDDLIIGTWITATDHKLRMERRYQIIRRIDDTTVLRARTDWVCCAISSGKPQRMPTAFVDGYGAALIQ